MSLLLHRFVGAGKAGGGPSGYYIKAPYAAQYYPPSFRGVTPTNLAAGGFFVGLTRSTPAGNRNYIMQLSKTGDVTEFKLDTSNYNGPHLFSSMSEYPQFGYLGSGSSSFDARLTTLYSGSGQNGTVAFINKNSLTYQSPLLTHTSGDGPIGCDSISNRIYYSFTTGGGYQPTLVHIHSRDAANGNSIWGKYYTLYNNSWGIPYQTMIRVGDTNNVRFMITRSSSINTIAFMDMDRATGTPVGQWHLNTNVTNPPALSMIQDNSGHMYLGTYNGNIIRVNFDNTTVDYAKTYAYNGQNFGYTRLCFYDGYIYGTGSEHANGNYIFKLNPSNGTINWFISMTGAGGDTYKSFYTIRGISASADGIAVTGESLSNNGYQNAYFLNYPLNGGITGTYGDITFTSGSPSVGNFYPTFDSLSAPSLTNTSNTGTGSYTSSLSTTASVMDTKVSL